MTTATLEEFKKAVEKDGYDLDDPATAVTLAAYSVGPNVKRIAAFLGRPREWCREAGLNLRQNGVWRGGRVMVEDPERGPDGVELAVQVGIAKGWLEAA